MTFFTLIRSEYLKWIGIISVIFAILLSAKKSGRDAERTKVQREQSYHDKQTIKQDGIIRAGAGNIKRMSKSLSDKLRRKRNS